MPIMKLSLPQKRSFVSMGLALAAMTLLVMLQAFGQSVEEASELARPMSVTPTDEPMLAPQPLTRDVDRAEGVRPESSRNETDASPRLIVLPA